MNPSDIERWSDRLPHALVAITVLALLARLLLLGDRIAHWDEGRVGYDVLRYMATGAWEYRPIVHGPFIPQVNKFVFAALGANDATARLVVALVGGLLPLSAWLYRDYLRRSELLALALFLAADPVLLYYSRFMRNDVLVATFAVVGLGFYLRFKDTRLTRHLYAGTAAWALAFTAKENAMLYVLAILGAGVLLLDHRLFLARDRDPTWTAVARRHVSHTARELWRYKLPLAIAAVEFLLVIVYFYAPRAGTTGGIGLFKAFARPSMLPAVVEAATVGAAEDLYGLWVAGHSKSMTKLARHYGHFFRVLGGASGPLALLSVFGFVVDRYTGERPRDLVALGFYWGAASVFGYPIVTDIANAWIVVNAVVPLSIPAAVGVRIIYEWGIDALAADDEVSVALAGVVLLLLAGQVGATAVSTSYLHPQSEGNVLVQYAQPEGEMRPALRAMREAAPGNRGLDVLWYGDHFHVENDSSLYRLPTADGEWYNRLPLPWYVEAANATANSTANPEVAARIVAAERPPVIITREQEADEIRDRVSGYREFAYEGRQFSLTFVFFIAEEHAPPARAAPGTAGTTADVPGTTEGMPS